MWNNARINQFGSSGIVLRARIGETLPLEQIKKYCPSIFAEEKHSSRSDKYTFIPTESILSQMMKEGFLPVEVRQGGSRDTEKRAYTKHLIRFQPASLPPLKVGDSIVESTLLNAHDGTSLYQTGLGVFCINCLNGLVACEDYFPTISTSHRGNVDDIIEASYRVIKEVPLLDEHVKEFSQLQLTGPEQEIFANAAISLRWQEGEVQPYQALRVRRSEDSGNDLWRTFNRVQENLTKGGIMVQRENEHGQVSRRRSRPVNGVSDTLNLNRALWTLAEEMRKLKAA